MSTTHLRALQALELAIRKGSLSDAAAELSITPAALGQRIRTLEEFLDLDLILRGRKGTRPTPELEKVLPDLHSAFSCLERVTEELNFQKAAAIHIVADLDLAELWLAPRLQQFRAAHPNVKFCINGVGDVPSRIGSPDVRIESGANAKGNVLFDDHYVPVASPEILWRVGLYDKNYEMEGVSLLHVPDRASQPDWAYWSETFGKRKHGLTRGQQYLNTSLALDATRKTVGFMLCGIALAELNLREGTLALPFPAKLGIKAESPYRVWTRKTAAARPQLKQFVDWLHNEGEKTQAYIERKVGSAGE